jgi:hypothetical protein
LVLTSSHSMSDCQRKSAMVTYSMLGFQTLLAVIDRKRLRLLET